MLNTFETTYGPNEGPLRHLWGNDGHDMGSSFARIYHDDSGNFTGVESGNMSREL